MTNLKIVTNGQPRGLMAVADIPEKYREDFDYMDPEEHHSPRLFKYKDQYYDLGDIMSSDSFGPYWHAACHHTAWSGVLIHVCDSDARVIVGHYYS